MMSTQEPNTMAPQSALCICSRKWQAKLIIPICFGNKTSKSGLRIISFSSLESELSFDLKDSQPSVKSLLGALQYLKRRGDKINHRLRFYCAIDRSSPWNCSVYLSLSGILLQQLRAPLEAISVHFLNMYCIILKEMRRREIFDLPG